MQLLFLVSQTFRNSCKCHSLSMETFTGNELLNGQLLLPPNFSRIPWFPYQDQHFLVQHHPAQYSASERREGNRSEAVGLEIPRIRRAKLSQSTHTSSPTRFSSGICLKKAAGAQHLAGFVPLCRKKAQTNPGMFMC